MSRREPRETPIDPADLAAGYMFPELFDDEPLLRSQEATETAFQPSAAVQHTMPDLPPIDREHIRRRQAARRRGRVRRKPPQPTVITEPS